MASPPRQLQATSPTYPQHMPLPNPKKRPSLHLSSNPAKRRKQTGSMHSIPASAHPLRQTSFPPEEGSESALRSPSVESDLTAATGNQSAVTGGGGGGETGKKRGRKKKNRNVSGSVRSGGNRAPTDGGGGGGQGRRGGRRATSEVHDEEDDEDDDDHGADLTASGGVAGNDIDRDAERKNLAVLVDAFNPDQADRYEMYRRVKLRKEVVRRITNHVVSQSVPPSVILSINGYTKTFIGSIIERAREVQEQWAAAEALGTPPLTPGKEREGNRMIEVDPTDFGRGNPANREVYTSVRVGGERGEAGPGPVPVDPARLMLGGAIDTTRTAAQMSKKNGEPAESGPGKKRDLGPLRPDHLREAVRRLKRDGEGGGTGFTGVSVGMGLQGTGAARLQGKRLFK